MKRGISAVRTECIGEPPHSQGVLTYFSEVQLETNFNDTRVALDMLPAIAISRATGELVQLVLNPGREAVRKFVLRKLRRKLTKVMLRQGMRRVVRVILRTVLGTILNCIAAFVAALLKKVVLGLHAARAEVLIRLRAQAAGAKPGSEVDQIVQQGIVAGAEAFAMCFVQEVEGLLAKGLQKSLKEFFPGFTFKEEIKRFVTKKVVTVCTTEAFSFLLTSIADAVRKVLGEKGRFDQTSFEQALMEKLKAGMRQWLTPEKWEKEFAEALADSVNL